MIPHGRIWQDTECGIVQGDCRLRVAGSNSHRFMFPLAIAALGPIVRVLLSAAVALQMTSFDLLCLFGLFVWFAGQAQLTM